MKRLIPITLELFGIAVVGGGMGVELALHADLGYMLITGGSLVVCIGGIIWGKFVRGGR